MDDIAVEDVSAWKSGLDDVLALVAGAFRTASVRWRARAYLTGLLTPIERKTAWQLSESAGEPNPDGVQHFLDRAVWSVDTVRDALRSPAAASLAGPGGVLVVDEASFIKKDHRSAGVQRQYSGTASRIENSQLGVFLAYAGERGRAFLEARRVPYVVEVPVKQTVADLDGDKCSEGAASAGIPPGHCSSRNGRRSGSTSLQEVLPERPGPVAAPLRAPNFGGVASR